MKAKSLSELASNIDTLESQVDVVENEITELKSLLRRFTDPDRRFDESDPLPIDFDFAATSNAVTQKMQERHKLTAALDAANREYDASRKSQQEAALKEIKKRHAESVIRLLQAAVALASAVRDQADCCDEASRLDRRYSGGGPRPIGPPFPQWDIRERFGVLFVWLREAKTEGFIDGKEPWLISAGIKL